MYIYNYLSVQLDADAVNINTFITIYLASPQCCDECLLIQDKERHREITSLLGSMPDERFALLVNLGKKITDYSVDKDYFNDGN